MIEQESQPSSPDAEGEPTSAENSNLMDKLRGVFSGKKDYKKMIIASVIILAVGGMIAFMIWGWILALRAMFTGDPFGGYFSPKGDCYMPDQYWTDPSPELTVEIIKERVPSYKAVSKPEKDKELEKLLSQTRKAGYNPVVTLAIWGKESTYGTDPKNRTDPKTNQPYEFGYLKEGWGGFDKQLEGAISTLDKAYKGEDPYPKKPGVPIQVNWLEIYTPSNVQANAGDKKTFFTIVQQAMPDQVICSAASALFGPEIAGKYYPPYGNYMNKITRYNNSAHGTSGHGLFWANYLGGIFGGFSNVRDGAIDYNVKNGSRVPVYAACDGKITHLKPMHYSTYGRGAGVIWLRCNDGTSGAIYAHIEFATGLSGGAVKKGQQIARTALHCGRGVTQCVTFNGSEHLHFQFYINRTGLTKEQLIQLFPKQ